jgi:iron complex outermembrane receptor protein
MRVNSRDILKRRITSVLAAALAAASGAAVAQQAAAPQLEEIIVTAQKRDQSLLEVPLSVSVTSQETLQKAHIVDLIDLQSVVPSLKVQQFNAVGQTNFFIRGFGNGSGNDGIESSVGVFVDGVYRSRTSSALDDLPEVERIEVLRGPQSTLFGKNVSAGAISIVTARPQSTFGGTAEVGFGNDNLMVGRAAITGPIGDTVAFRLSGSTNQRDGYMKNLTTGHEVNDRDRYSVRGDLLWTPSDEVAVRVIADYNKITETCCGVVTLQNGPATQFIAAPPPYGLGAPVGDPAKKFDRNIVFNTDPTNRLTGKGISAQVDWNVGFATLTSITAYRNQTNESWQDVDFTGADLANKDQPNESKTFTQELRLASTGEGPVSWLAGAFFQDESLDSGVTTLFGSRMRAYADGLATAPACGGSCLGVLEYYQGLPIGTTYFAAGQGIYDYYTMDQTAYSLFGQVDFKVTDALTLTGGLAYLNDHKAARSNVVLTDKFSLLNLQTTLGGAFAGLGGLQFFYGNDPAHAPTNFPNANESGKLDGDKVTYALRAAYDFGAVNAYVSYSTGWKAGAYNLSSDSRPPDVNGVGRTADPEDVTNVEVGLKAGFQGGYVNLAIFDQSIKGFQSNNYTGTGYALVNAGKQTVKGFELDAAYRPINWLDLTGAATYLDAKYDSFKSAPCVSYDTVNCPIVNGQMPPFRDLSGKRPAGIPEWTVSMAATLSHAFGNGFGSYLRGEYNYVSSTQLFENTPPELSTWGQNFVNASLGLTNEPHKYEVMIWARNLTNDDTMVATFPTVAQTGSYSGFPNQPRTYGVTFRKKW